MTAPHRIGSIASTNASLIVAVFDASTASAWEPTAAMAATKAQFTGHPAQILRGLGQGAELTEIDVGTSTGFAFELEARTGALEVYRDGDTLMLVAPPRVWWHEPANHGAHADEVAALFDEVVSARGASDATEHGEITLPSGKLAIVYIWLRTIGAAQELANRVPPGAAMALGDARGGLVVDLPPGRYRLRRREVAAPWADDQALFAAYLVPET